MKGRPWILIGTLSSLALLVPSPLPVLAAGLFQPAVNSGVGTEPYSVAVGDFNGDGKPDLAVANINNSGPPWVVSVLLGIGNGTFQAAVNYGVGAHPESVAVGDFNGDGKPDLAVASISDSLSILIGNGDGSFQSATGYGAGPSPNSVAVGDFNGDGKLDLAVADAGSNPVSILLGNGDGTFQPAVGYPAGNYPDSIAVGDFNGDGKPDLAVANQSSNNVSILIGNGDGTFQAAANYAVGMLPWAVAVGDFNGDGKSDLAVTNYSSNTVSILIGNGDGTFQAAANIQGLGNGNPYSLAVGDFNGDGKPDLAVTHAGNVSILLGKGDGTFLSPDNYAVGSQPISVAVGDFNFDGKPDLAVANENSNNISILVSNRSPYSPGLLRVVSSPAVPTQILLDGQIADSWGLNWLKQAPFFGHTVCFTHVEGWTEPPCQGVTVDAGATTTVTGSFIQRGELRVITSPAAQSQIEVDGNPTNDGGMWTDIATGSHTVCFGAVANFNPPPCQTATVTAGNQTTITGTFTSQPGAVGQSGEGLLRTVSSNAVPAQITITPPAGSPYTADSWGLNWLELPPGSYTISFSHVQGWTEPAPQVVPITAGNTTVVAANFIHRGFLRVLTSPAAAGTITVDGVPHNDWGMWTDIATGSHTVCFGQAAGYANTPACQTTTVNAGVETDVTGAYS